MKPHIPHPPRRSERGQAMVLLALALVGILGFAALAIDGGNLYTEQRRAQAAADNAAMAAAYQQMRGGTTFSQWSAAAFAMAANNGFNNDQIQNFVYFRQPPTHGPYANDPRFIEVEIRENVTTVLAHMVYGQNPVPVTVWAVAHGSPSGPVMEGYAIAAMKSGCDDNGNSTIYMQGRGGGSTGGTILTGAGMFVNGSCPNSLNMSGSGETVFTNGNGTPFPIDVVGGYSGSACTSPSQTGCNFYPAPNTGVAPRQQDPLAGTPAGTPPGCGPTRNLNTELNDADGPIIQPGSYTELAPGGGNNGVVMTMAPGIYCLTSTSNSNGILSAGQADGVVGNGVLIYLTNTGAKVDFSGQGYVNLSGPSNDYNQCDTNPTQNICKYKGILIYKNQDTNGCGQNDTAIDFTGSSTMNVVGLIYAPYSLVRYGGQGDLYMTGQTIAACVKFNGNGYINIVYDPDVIYSPPPDVILDQ